MKIPFAPAIYEHKAALIGKTPYQVSRDPELLKTALQREKEWYSPDFFTVGVDIYNLELEAMGIGVRDSGNACPELEPIPAHFRWRIDILSCGRFDMMLQAAADFAVDAGAAQLRVAATGPVTLAAKIMGLENLIVDLYNREGEGLELLAAMTELSDSWLQKINRHGFSGILFDSMAAPPLFSPPMYEEWILPCHAKLFCGMKRRGQSQRELVIGGDTTSIAGLLKQTGANLFLCDYAANAADWKNNFGNDQDFLIRRNLSPEDVKKGHRAAFFRDLECFTHPVAGTGIIPFDFPTAALRGMRSFLE